MIKEDALAKNKEIWIYFHDMSKAYDRVNTHILKIALKRIKLPTQIITVITEHGCSLFYDVHVGTDQGEVISPLIWIIYYDPLLCRL